MAFYFFFGRYDVAHDYVNRLKYQKITKITLHHHGKNPYEVSFGYNRFFAVPYTVFRGPARRSLKKEDST